MSIVIEPVYLPAEVAALFRVDPKTVGKWANKGLIPSFRTLGGHRRFPKAEVDALLSGAPVEKPAPHKVGSIPVREVEVGNWIALDGDIQRVDDIDSDDDGQLVLTFASGAVDTLHADYPVEILRDEPPFPSMDGGKNA